MGSSWLTAFVPKPELAVQWGLGIPIRSIWPEAVWESPTTPCRKGAGTQGVFTNRTQSQKFWASIRLLCLRVGCWVTSNPWVGGANPANPLNFPPAQSEGREAQEPGCVPRWYLGEAEEPTIHC